MLNYAFNDRMECTDGSQNEPILYELLEYFVRKQESELIKWKSDAIILPTTGTIKNALRYLNNRYSLPKSISELVGLTLPWKFAVADCGRLLALLQENVIEIRKSKDEYSSIVGKASVPKDAFLQWRKLAWSPDGTMLVLASSNGYLSFYNSMGSNVFNISPKTTPQNYDILEVGDAIASILFLKPRIKHEKWSYEFIMITYSGLLKSYYVSLSGGFSPNYEFSFGSFYKNGINAIVYDEKHSLFYVAGNAMTQKLTSKASESGLTSWRLLNDYPYCKLSVTFDEDGDTKPKFSIWNIIPTLNFQAESIIFNIKISPNNEQLACLHTDGSVSLWHLPNLTLQKKWKLSEQPGFNIPNPLGFVKLKKFPPGITEFHPVDVGWWSEQAIIIARYSGSISVCSIKNLNNLLGSSPEFLCGQPQICELGSDRGFLCLDCETFVASRKRKRESSNEGQVLEVSSESEKEDDELEHISILNYTTNLVQSTLYSITDMERFQPKRKRSKVLYRTYRILGLKSTTPEELYTRKIDIEEYEEALALANTYNLDTDLVYQTQWRKSELSLNAIHEHLSKVTKRSWVLNECIIRVPDTIEAARELLKFGLKGANLETLLAIGVCDNGKFVVIDTDEVESELDEKIGLKEIQKINEILEQIDVENLTEGQKDLIRYRRKLLDHLDKLLIYEIILEPPLTYSKTFYEEFRQLSAVENAIRFAKDSDCRAVEIMFTYYGDKLLPYWLAIISFFPETLSPLSYQKLLPKCDSDGQLFLPDQCELRQKDWSERKMFNEVINFNDNDESQLLYEVEPSLNIYSNVPLTSDLLQKWYRCRAYEIERNSFMVDNALQLIKIAKEHNIRGLEDLLINLETLDDLVYKVYLDDMTLDQLEKLNDLEKIKLLMGNLDESSFVRNIKRLLLPFMKRKQEYAGGNLPKHLLRNYLICISKDDLKLPAKLFEHLRQTQEKEILSMLDVPTLALDCMYACNDVDMYQKAKYILDTISKEKNGKKMKDIYNSLEELERELECLKILNKYNVKVTLNFIHDNKNNPEIVKALLNQMARSLNKLKPPPDEKQWAQLLNQMLEIHGTLFDCVDIEICFEICVSARLMSGIKSNIQNCAALIETKKSEQSLLKVSYNKAVNLILEASKEYFNSSKSLVDSNMELSKACLHLILDDNYVIKEEYDLINSLQILNEFNVNILPLQVRSSQDKLKLIEDCLNKREDGYKSRQRLLTLANYLHIEKNNTRLREGKVLELIAKKALEMKDYSFCAIICQQLMQNNYIPAWTVALELGYSEDFNDLRARRQCLWFAINNGTNDILIKALEHMHLIEVQILHKNLQSWIPLDTPEDFTDDIESDDEFADAMTTPQVETKEFIPKVFETSTEIVKNSANIMKESTYGLIKNISDTNFWKSRLKFSFVDSVQSDTKYEDENIQQETDAEFQSFPYFYKTLHNNNKISDLDTKYTSYSMPEIQNIKLNCCRALIRIALLNESSCYGLEITDINHLLLECARHTIQNDWLLSIGYLLSLNKSYKPDTQSFFINLPQTKLCIQTALYYYSLELYQSLFDSSEELYLYDPLQLIRKMLIIAQDCNELNIQNTLLYWKSKLTDHLELSNENEYDKEENTVSEQDKNINISTVSEDKDQSTEEEKVLCLKNDELHEYSNKLQNTEEDMLDSPDDKWTDDWGNFSDEDAIENMETTAFIKEDKIDTEESRFLIFLENYNKITSIEDYQKVKQLLLQWPMFHKHEFTRVDVHPALKMIKAANAYNITENSVEEIDFLLEECRDLVKHMAATNVLEEFLKQETGLPLNCNIYLHLCSTNETLHKEAINIIKDKYESMKLAPLVLEEIFLKDLTLSFEPNHPVYTQIIKHIFENHSLSHVKEHAYKLIEKLIEQKHVMHALSIQSLMESIPPSLNTFSTCFQLLTKK